MIPILLLTGFLGAGKTTFLNWLIEKNPDFKISIILNEFGDTKLETQFVKKQSAEVIELANGCMCCVAKSDIPRVVSLILEKSPQTEYLIIEASGLSDPDPVHEALKTLPMSSYTYLESTICIVDSLNFEKMRGENAIITSQIADADLVILSKIDEAGVQQTELVRSAIKNLIPDIQVLEFSEFLPPEIFLTKGIASDRYHKLHFHVHEDYDIYIFENTQPLLVDPLINFIESLSSNVIRIKAVVLIEDKQGNQFWVQLQRVGSRLSIENLSITPKELKSTILFIGKEMDKSRIQKSLKSFIQTV